MLPKSFALSDDDEESDCSIPRDDCEVQALSAGVDNPITINEYSSTAVELPNLCWHGYSNCPKSLTLTNTGESVQITGKWGRGRPYVTGGPLSGSYLFSQIHFHWPSEHTLNEKRYPLEMHAVHYKASYLTQERAMKESDGTIVLVYLFEVAQETTTNMVKITNLLSKISTKNSKTELCDSSLEDFMKPFLSNYFIYWGSAKIGQESYSLQWIISCSRQPISQKEFCDLKELFRNEERDGANKPTRDAEPQSQGLFLVGETVNRTCSETRRPEVRFSDTEKSYATQDKTKSCCFLAKYRNRNSNSSQNKDYTNKSVEEIYCRPSSSGCSQESSPCARNVNRSMKSCTDKNCQTRVSDPRNMNTQTSRRSVSICSCSSKSKLSSSSGLKSKCSDSYSYEDICSSSVASSKDETSCQKRKSKTVKCFLKNNETHDCIDNGCENQFCSLDSDRNIYESKKGNRNKKTKKETGNRRKHRKYSSDNTSNEDEGSEKIKCTLSCELLEIVKDGQESKVLQCKADCPEESEEAPEKENRKEKPQKTEERSQSDVTIEELPEDKKVKKKKVREKSVGTKKSTSKTENVDSEDAEDEVKAADVKKAADATEEHEKPSKKKSGKKVETVPSDDSTKEMGQHKPIILAQARINENTYILKSVGTMTVVPPYSGHAEEIGLAAEGGEPYLSDSSISSSQILRKTRSSAKEHETLDKMMGIPEHSDTKDLEVILRKLLAGYELSAPKEQLPAKTVLTEEANDVVTEQSLASLLAKISKDQSLGNILSNISSHAAQSSDLEKVAGESSFGSILAKMAKDPSLAYILAKITRDPCTVVVSTEPSGTKVAAGPSNVMIEPKLSTGKISREPSVSAIWAKLKNKNSASSDVDKSSKEPSLTSVLAELNRDVSVSNDLNKVLKEPNLTSDPDKSSNEQKLTIILASVSRNRKLASESVSKHSSLTSVLSKNSKDPTTSNDFVKTSKHQSADAFGICKDFSVQEVIKSRQTKEEPHILVRPSKQETAGGSTKEQSLVSFLIRVSKEPSLARDLANILRNEPLSEEMTRSKEQSFACVLIKISKEPSLASDLANILKKESVADSIRLDPVSTHSTGVAKPSLTKSAKEESLANILVTVSKEPLLAADLAKCSKHQSLASILTKISKASSLVVDVANVLDNNPPKLAVEGSIPSILESKSEKEPKIEDSRECSRKKSVVGILKGASKQPSLVSENANISLREPNNFDQEKPTVERSLTSVLTQVSKEPSLALDITNVLKTESGSSAEIKKTKEQSLGNILTAKSRVASLTKDLKSNSDELSIASVLSMRCNKSSPVSCMVDASKQEFSYEKLAESVEDGPLTCHSPMVADMENSPQEACRIGDLAEPADKSLSVISGEASRGSSFVNEVVKSIVEASLKEIQPSANKNSSLAPETNKYSKNQSLANILNKVSREPSLANDLAKSFAKESLVEIFLAVARQPSLASDISRFSKNQSLVNMLNRVSREPSLAKDLADSVVEDTLTEILFAVTKQPSLASEISKYSKNQSVVNILNRISKEPFLADDITNSMAEDIMIEILLAVTKEPSLASSISKNSKNQSLNNVLDRVSREPSLAVDLAKSLAKDSLTDVLMTVVKQHSMISNVSKHSKKQSLVSVLDKTSRTVAKTTDSANILKEEFSRFESEESEKEESWGSDPYKNAKSSSTSSMKSVTPKEASIISDSLKFKDQSLASVLDWISQEPSGSTSSIKSVIEQSLAHILAAVVKEPSTTTEFGELKPYLADILLKVSREPSLAPNLALIAEQWSKEPSPPPDSAKELSSVDNLTKSSKNSAKENSSTNVLIPVSGEVPVSSTSEDCKGDGTSCNGKPLVDCNSPRDRQTSVGLAPSLIDHTLENHLPSTTGSRNLSNALQKSPISSPLSRSCKELTPGECLNRSVKDLSLPTKLARSSPETLQASDKRPSGIFLTNNLEKSNLAIRSEEFVLPEERATVLQTSRSYTVSKDKFAKRYQLHEHGKGRANFEVEKINSPSIDTERPEVEQLHRQEDLNESIQSRRSTETRSVDDEMAVDSYKKKTAAYSEGNQLDLKAEAEEKDMQPFEEYYVRVETENSVLKEYAGELDETEVKPKSSMKLRLLPKTSVPMNDLNLEMEDCIIRFDSKEKTEELYVEAHFLVGKKASSLEENGNSNQSIRPSSMRALEITNDIEDKDSENSVVRKNALYFISEAIEVDPKTGKKILTGRFARDK